MNYLTLLLKLASTVTEPPPGITVPTLGIESEVKWPLASNTVRVVPLTVVLVRLWNVEVGSVTPPEV